MSKMKNHQKEETKGLGKKQKIIIAITAIVIILVIVIIFVLTKKEDATYIGESQETNKIIEEPKEVKEETEYVDVSDIPEEIEDYTVIGKIVIEKINVEKYILGRSTKKSLNLGVAKFWGPHINDFRKFLHYWT